MKELLYKKIVRCPIHGYIDLTEVELELLKVPIVQRLRRIQQLSFVDYVYPDASHSRFSHSLGVMHLAGKFARHLGDLYDNLGIDDNVIQATRIAGLLHDIGHGPFAHASESPIEDFILPSFPSSSIPLSSKLEEANAHEKLAEYYIRNSEISNILEKHEVDINQVIQMIKGHSEASPILGRILSNELDADKMDYLRRDAHHAGVFEYGALDIDRLIFSSRISRAEEDIVYYGRGAYAAEAMILARFHMYKAVYFHKTVRAANALATRALYYAFSNEEGLITKEDFDPGSFPYLTDGEVISRILRKGKESKKYMTQLLHRDLPKVVLDAQSLSKPRLKSKIFRKLLAPNLNVIREYEQELACKLGCGYEDVFIDSTKLVAYPGELEEKVYVEWGGEEKPLSEVFEHLATLGQSIQSDVRVYLSDKYLISRRDEGESKDSFVRRISEEVQDNLNYILKGV